MDIATLIGLFGAVGVVIAAMMSGGSIGVFVNVPSLMIVIAGTALVVLIKFNLKQFLGAFKVAARAFSNKLDDPADLLENIVSLAGVARKEGLLGLENEEIPNEFLKGGIMMLVDGTEGEVVSQVMSKDLKETIDRHKWGEQVFVATTDVAPAMGMIGTLIGLVQMLSAMDDPKSIGPAMAVALLTTLYGAMIANMFSKPIADKLHLRKTEEGKIKSMCIDGVLAIGEGQNPRIIESMLKIYIDPTIRDKEEEKKE